MVKKLATLIFSLLACFGLTYVFLVIASYNAQFYKYEDIAETCEILNLSSHYFCITSNRVNQHDLEQALATQYPPSETSYSEIMDSIQQTVYFAAGTCSNIATDINNPCPEPSQCTSAYSCYVNTPVQRVYVMFSSDGAIERFSVSRSDS